MILNIILHFFTVTFWSKGVSVQCRIVFRIVFGLEKSVLLINIFILKALKFQDIISQVTFYMLTGKRVVEINPYYAVKPKQSCNQYV